MNVGVLRKTDGTVVCARCGIADTPLLRMRGLLGRSSLAPDEGLLIRPAGSIHMLFMRFAIDAVFCDRDLRVLAVRRDLRPWRFAAARRARVVFELPVGAAASLAAGDQLVVEDARPLPKRVIFAPERVIVRDGAKVRPDSGVLADINEPLHIHEADGPSDERRHPSVVSNQEGQTMAEYSIILAAVALLATAAFLTFGQAIVSMFGPIVDAVTS